MKLLWWSDSDRREPVGPVNGRNRSPTGWSRPADCRTCPTLRNLFPTSPSSFCPIPPFFSVPARNHLLLPFGTRRGKVRSFGPLSALSAPLNRSFTTGLFYRNHTFLLPAVRVTLLPPSSSSSRQPQLFPYTEDQLSIHRGPALPHSLRRSTPPATSEAEACGASTFQGPPDTRTLDEHLK